VEHTSLVELGLHDDRIWRDLDLGGLSSLRRLVVPSLSVIARAVLPASLDEVVVCSWAGAPQASVEALPRSVARVTVHLRELAFSVDALSTVPPPTAGSDGFVFERASGGAWQRSTF
jgi:hypothetical protein